MYFFYINISKYSSDQSCYKTEKTILLQFTAIQFLFACLPTYMPKTIYQL